ncbi:MAG: hypothetical protein R3C11_14075 [Planctomycetaceae bacterium]
METLSQLLAWNCVEKKIHAETAHYNVTSISRLLSVLPDSTQIQRISDQQNSQIGEWAEAGFEILDRPKLSSDADNLTPDQIPMVIGELLILKESPENNTEKRVIITSDSHESLEKAISIVKDSLQGLTLEDESRNDSLEEMSTPPGIPAEHQPFYWRWGFPQKFPAKPRMELFLQRWEDLIYNSWLETPQSILDNQKPAELEANSARKYATAHVLDALSGQRQMPLNLSRLLEKLELSPLPKVKPDDEHTLSSLTAMQFNRLDYSDLSDDEMLNVMNRALLTHYSQILESVLVELLQNRPGCDGKFDRFRAYRTLSQIAIFNNQEERAIQWIESALAEASKLENSFEPVFEWKLRKLTVLLRDPKRPEVTELVKSMSSYYGSKIPEFRKMLAGLQADLNLDVGILTADAASGESPVAEGVWSPEQAETGGEKKLWIPGQD